ncbi:MAG: class I SAM-dependent methyltransferase [Verrucomicrobiae bacterium]|nr:class I SAM-dependent methyltransferase [Verrucomicrobiae bacterium]
MNDSDANALVATILGWKCCCDIPLAPVPASSDGAPGHWEGAGFSGKDDTGVSFQLRLTPSATQATPSAPTSPQIPNPDSRFFLSLTLTVPGGQTLTQSTPSAAPAAQTPTSILNPHSSILTFLFSIPLFGEPQPDDGIPRDQLVVLVSGHAALKARFRNYAFGLSYLPVVWHRLLLGQGSSPPPRRILEWGPGRSTIAFAELFPEAEIDGVEHDPRWFAHCQALEAAFPDGRVRMHHRRLAIAPGRAEAYVTWPLYQASPETKYDLIFIDGRLRADCAAVARLILAEGGTVLIHDAHRDVYQPVFGLYPAGEVVYNTGVLGER